MKEIQQIAQTLQISEEQVQSTLKLLEEGNTVPFIARYRKEMTKGLDEEQIREIQEVYTYKINLAKRKDDVLRLIEEKGKLTQEIKDQVEHCEKLSQVEDIYRPYKQKKKTRASDAIAQGLEPLAAAMLKYPKFMSDLDIPQYFNEEIQTQEQALQGAMDIIAESVSDDSKCSNKNL